MSSNYNRVTLVGHIGCMELRPTASGKAMLFMSIAENYEYLDKVSGEHIKKVEWHRATAFGSLAEAIFDHQDVGCKILVEGKLRTRKYEDKNGVLQYFTGIILDQAIFLNPSEALPVEAEDEEVQHARNIELLKKLNESLEREASFAESAK